MTSLLTSFHSRSCWAFHLLATMLLIPEAKGLSSWHASFFPRPFLVIRLLSSTSGAFERISPLVFRFSSIHLYNTFLRRLCICFLLLLKPNYHRLSGLNNTNVLSHSSGSQKPEISVWAGLCSLYNQPVGENPPLPLPSFWCFASNHGHSLSCSCITPVSASIFAWHSLCVSVSSHGCLLIRTSVILDKGLPFSSMISSLLIIPVTTLSK